jgi:transposase
MDISTELLPLSRKETPRPGILRALIAGHITGRQAAAALHVSVRQVRRLRRRFEREGAVGLVHRGRGRPSPHQLEATGRTEMLALMRGIYADLNDVHVTEKLQEVHGFMVCRETVRRLRLGLARGAKRPRRAPRYRQRRTPAPAAGSLIQVDGSPHAWLETRGPQFVLLGAIDDATGAILALHFRPAEDLHGYATLFRHVFTEHGLPIAVYGDRLNVFVRNDRHWTLAEQLQGHQDPTHLGRMLRELGIAYIAAQSPQGKGRIERLWATLQDRLVSELRLAGITTLEAANAFLPAFIADFNRRFGRPPASPTPVWRRPPRPLAAHLCCRYVRVVARDNTVRLGARWLTIPRGPRGRSYVGLRVDVHELLDGRLQVLHEGQLLAEQPAPLDFVFRPRRAPHDRAPRPPRPTPARRPAPPPRPRLSPQARQEACTGPNHPWSRAATLHQLRKAARARA